MCSFAETNPQFFLFCSLFINQRCTLLRAVNDTDSSVTNTNDLILTHILLIYPQKPSYLIQVTIVNYIISPVCLNMKMSNKNLFKEAYFKKPVIFCVCVYIYVYILYIYCMYVYYIYMHVYNISLQRLLSFLR